jgi:hypothetical protein
MLVGAILLDGTGLRRDEVKIAGYGIFDREMEQIGWRALPEPIVVPKGRRVEISKTIIV